MIIPKYNSCRLLVVTLILVTLAGCGTGSGPTSIPDQPERPTAGLIWAEEFNGSSLDTNTWNIETGYGSNGWGNDEWQSYTNKSDNVKVENGNLVLTARCDSGACGKRDGSITSARINTKDNFSVKYGKIKARIKVPTGVGTWPAFWMLGSSFDTVGWPKSGEIDIMEMHNKGTAGSNNRTTHSAIHWWADSNNPPG